MASKTLLPTDPGRYGGSRTLSPPATPSSGSVEIGVDVGGGDESL